MPRQSCPCYSHSMSDRVPAHVITTHKLSKHYGSIKALNNVDLLVPGGVIFGFLGPNGAGKTTLIRLLMGFIKSTSGSASIYGHETWKDGVNARRHVGYLVQSESLFPDLSGEEQLDFAARVSGVAPTNRSQLLDLLELSSRDLKRKMQTYSKGMRQKLALTAAAQHDPPLLILDEPTDGLDPLIQRAFESFIRERHVAGRTIFMSSHDLSEVERLCERVAVVRDGVLVEEATIEGLKQLHRRRAIIEFSESIPAGLDAVDGVEVASAGDRRASLLLGPDPNPLFQFLARHDVAEITITPPSLDDIFVDFYREQAPQSDGRPPGASTAIASRADR
jgi:ABC-2 type transport system ATP-binding protein